MNKGLRCLLLLGVLASAFLFPSPRPAHALGSCQTMNGGHCSNLSKPVACTNSDGTAGVCFCENRSWVCN